MTTTASLTARLLAAIDETERLALHAHGDTWSVGSAFAVKSTDGEEVIAEGEPGSGGGVIDIPTTAHIVLHDPKRELRHCAAARRIVVRHEVYGDGYRKCTSCGERWPCPDLRDIAAAYDITTEEESDGSGVQH